MVVKSLGSEEFHLDSSIQRSHQTSIESLNDYLKTRREILEDYEGPDFESDLIDQILSQKTIEKSAVKIKTLFILIPNLV